jgi:uncharacterized protein (DUF2141 family)
MKWFPAASAAALMAASAFAQSTAVLTIESRTASSEGQVLMLLYDSEAAFDGNGAPVRMLEARPGEGLKVEGLASGRYGIKAFHDLDGDGALGMNPFGVPTEPFAFSNGARPHRGPPRWAEAAFDLPASGAVQTLVFGEPRNAD